MKFDPKKNDEVDLAAFVFEQDLSINQALIIVKSQITDNYECCKEIVFCWGAFDVVGRDKIVAKMFPEAKALILNRKGSPRHPLYFPKDT